MYREVIVNKDIVRALELVASALREVEEGLSHPASEHLSWRRGDLDAAVADLRERSAEEPARSVFPARFDAANGFSMLRVYPMTGVVSVKANRAEYGSPVVNVPLSAETARELGRALLAAADIAN